MSAGIVCPVCAGGVLDRHCPVGHPTCTWGTCRKCIAHVDWVTKKHSHPVTIRQYGKCVTCGPVKFSAEPAR